MNKKLTKQEIEHLALELYSNNYHARIGFINGYNLSDQNTKPLIDEIAELKSKVSNWMDKYIEVNEENKKLQSELKDKESVNENFSKQHAKIIESLSYVRDNPKTWKSGGIGGQDQYAGMPPMLRYIDEIISYLTNQNK